MKAKNFWMVVLFAMFAAISFFACGRAGGPDGPDDVPQSISVDVKYIRIEPWYPDGSERVPLNWKYSDTQGSAEMLKIAENTYFADDVRIKTKTRITLKALDPRKRGEVRKRFIICFTLKEVYREVELIFNSPEYGEVVFIIHNNGTIEIVSPA